MCHFWAVTHTCSKLLPTRIIRSWILIFIAHRASNFVGDWFKHLDCIACGWRREPRKSHAPGRWPDKFSFLILNPTRLWQVRMSFLITSERSEFTDCPGAFESFWEGYYSGVGGYTEQFGGIFWERKVWSFFWGIMDPSKLMGRFSKLNLKIEKSRFWLFLYT